MEQRTQVLQTISGNELSINTNDIKPDELNVRRM